MKSLLLPLSFALAFESGGMKSMLLPLSFGGKDGALLLPLAFGRKDGNADANVQTAPMVPVRRCSSFMCTGSLLRSPHKIRLIIKGTTLFA